MPRVPDKLAFALSSGDAVTRAQYKRVFDRLYVTDGVRAGLPLDAGDHFRRDTVRDLEALGTCDFLYDEDRVRACAPFLSPLPRPGLPAAILVGGRTPEMLRRLRALARQRRPNVLMTACPQVAFPLLPNRVDLQAVSVDALHELGQAAGIPLLEVPAPALLLTHVASIESYVASRQWRPFSEPNWIRGDFDTARACFSRPRMDSASPRLSVYTHPHLQHQVEHFLIDEERAALVDRDWGRFCILAQSGRDVLLYDAAQRALFVPVTTPLPKLYARALTLCSGFAPQEVRDSAHGAFRVFVRVPQAYADLAATKLQQHLSPVPFRYVLRGGHD